MKGFTENAKVKFIDDKLTECAILGDDYKLTEMIRECLLKKLCLINN